MKREKHNKITCDFCKKVCQKIATEVYQCPDCKTEHCFFNSIKTNVMLNVKFSFIKPNMEYHLDLNYTNNTSLLQILNGNTGDAEVIRFPYFLKDVHPYNLEEKCQLYKLLVGHEHFIKNTTADNLEDVLMKLKNNVAFL